MAQSHFCYYSLFLPDFFAAAQRFRVASAMRFRAAADIRRRGVGVDLLALPGGRPRRFPLLETPPLTPSRTLMAVSSLSRSALSC